MQTVGLVLLAISFVLIILFLKRSRLARALYHIGHGIWIIAFPLGIAVIVEGLHGLLWGYVVTVLCKIALFYSTNQILPSFLETLIPIITVISGGWQGLALTYKVGTFLNHGPSREKYLAELENASDILVRYEKYAHNPEAAGAFLGMTFGAIQAGIIYAALGAIIATILIAYIGWFRFGIAGIIIGILVGLLGGGLFGLISGGLILGYMGGTIVGGLTGRFLKS